LDKGRRELHGDTDKEEPVAARVDYACWPREETQPMMQDHRDSLLWKEVNPTKSGFKDARQRISSKAECEPCTHLERALPLREK